MLLIACLAGARLAAAQPAAGAIADWPYYGGDAGGSRYSPLTEFDKHNVTELKIAWEYHTGDVVPLGTTADLIPNAARIISGTANLGGPIITAGGVVFIASAMDNYLRAFDVDTGAELWKGRLPAGGQAMPMTYRLRHDGKQFVVIAAGGHGKLGTKLGDSLVAFALP